MQNFSPVQLWLLMAAVAYVAFLFGRATKPVDPQERERRRLVEEAEIETAVSGLSASKWEEIDRLLSDRKKIEAIKVLREATGLGLKLSKMAVENRGRQQGM